MNPLSSSNSFVKLLVNCIVYSNRELKVAVVRLPRIHPAIDYGIVHGIAHCKPINAQIDFLHVFIFGNGGKCRCHDEIKVKRKPTHSENDDNYNHHFHNL